MHNLTISLPPFSVGSTFGVAKSKATALHIRYIVLLRFHFCCFLFLNGWGLAVIYNVAIYDAELMEFVRMPLN
ncbi:MAG: hypothetical protein E7069_13205 [Bacteroidales bacterium]|nr:hypothetical protein [Bacteroidales bacterium]